MTETENNPLTKAIVFSNLHHYINEERGIKKIEGKHSNLTGDCSKLSGDCSKLWGDSNLWGACSGLIGRCTDLVGNCTGLTGDCSGRWGDLDLISKEERLLNPNIENYVQ